MGLIIRWILAAIALFVTVRLGQAMGLAMSIEIGFAPFLAVLVLAVINALIRPIIKLLTLPLNCLTFGLLGLVINALMFWLAGAGWIEGFRIENFWAALFGSIVMGIVSGLLNRITRRGE